MRLESRDESRQHADGRISSRLLIGHALHSESVDVRRKADRKGSMYCDDLQVQSMHHDQHCATVEDRQNDACHLTNFSVQRIAPQHLSSQEGKRDQRHAVVPRKFGCTRGTRDVDAGISTTQFDGSKDELYDGVSTEQKELE